MHQASLSGVKCYFGSTGYSLASLLAALDSKGLGITASRCQHLSCFMHSKLSRKMEAKGAGVANWPPTVTVVSVVELAKLSGTPTWFCYYPINDKEELAVLKGELVSLYQLSVVFSFSLFYISAFLTAIFQSSLFHLFLYLSGIFHLTFPLTCSFLLCFAFLLLHEERRGEERGDRGERREDFIHQGCEQNNFS